jgi:hypothetical protein
MANRRCVKEISLNKKAITLENSTEQFTFDYVASEETAQIEVFE